MQPEGIVIWDWNGTLLDDVRFSVGCLNALLAQYGYAQRYDLAAYRKIFGFPIEEYYRRAGFDFARHPYPVLAQSYMDIYNAGVVRCPTMDGAAAALSALCSCGWRQAVLSVSRQTDLIEQVTARGLAGYFTELLGQRDIYGVSKVQAGREWLAQSGLDPAACVMVGDTDHDAEVAAAMGTQCVLCTRGHQTRAMLEGVCPHVIDSLNELPALLKTL